MTESDVAKRLAALIGVANVVSDAGALRAYECDAYAIEKRPPAAVALPSCSEDVQKIVAWCRDNAVPYTPRGAGTGLSGGAMAAMGGVVISTKRMTQILAIHPEDRTLLAQAGAVNQRVSDAVREFGLHFAPDPSSQSVSTLGGNVNENSGGPHTLKYGVTAQHVLGLTLVTPDAEIVRFGGPTGGPAGFDLLSLIVGSEGTLGVVTEVLVKLVPLPTAALTALAAFGTVRDATEAVAAIIASGTVPAALELMDRGILGALNAAFGLTYPPGTEALLLVECDSSDLEEGDRRVSEEMRSVESVCQAHRAIEFRSATSEAERQEFWKARKKGIGAMGRLAPTIVTHDGVIPRSKLPEMLDFVYATAAQHEIGVANLFHAGDGNLHPCFYFDDRDPRQLQAVIDAGEAVIRRCVELGGSVSGEHGIGVEKLDLMPLMFSEDDLEAQAEVKLAFHSGTLCNPCKALPNQKQCAEHRRRWRGAAW